MKKGFFFPLFLMTLSGCVSHMASLGNDSKSQNIIDDMRMEIAELKHNLHAQQVDMQIMEEKLSKSKLSVKNASDDKASDLNDRLHRLETAISQMQRFQENCIKDLKNLHEYVSKTSQLLSNQTEQPSSVQNELSLQTKRLQDFKELKTTLSTLKKAIVEPSPSSTSNTYKVKAGDSLEKIARMKGTSADEIRKLNHLESDTIRVGQELKVSYD